MERDNICSRTHTNWKGGLWVGDKVVVAKNGGQSECLRQSRRRGPSFLYVAPWWQRGCVVCTLPAPLPRYAAGQGPFAAVPCRGMIAKGSGPALKQLIDYRAADNWNPPPPPCPTPRYCLLLAVSRGRPGQFTSECWQLLLSLND